MGYSCSVRRGVTTLKIYLCGLGMTGMSLHGTVPLNLLFFTLHLLQGLPSPDNLVLRKI